MAEGDGKPGMSKGRKFAYWGLFIVWLIGQIWLSDLADYPKAFGVVPLHGKARFYQEYFDSYLLLERPTSIDIGLFVWMWIPVVGLAVYLARPLLNSLGGRRFSFFANPADDTANKQ